MDGQKIILVDEQDRQIGLGEKMQIHREGILHRAFSVFVLNKNQELLLQQRAAGKYHSGGLWSNTCCGHPSPGLSLQKCAQQRLMEEMGIFVPLQWLFSFRYKTEFNNNLIENELDHVLLGKTDQKPEPDLNEVSSWKWLSLAAIKTDLNVNPKNYTYWFSTVFNRFYDEYSRKQS